MKRSLFAFFLIFLFIRTVKADITNMPGGGGTSVGDNMGNGIANVAVVRGSGTYNNITSSGPAKFESVSSSSLYVSKDAIFYSTFQTGRFDGYIIIPGSVTALGIGESYTFSADGFTLIEIPILTEFAGGAEANQVRVTAKTATSFTIKNHSALAAKDVYFWCLGKR